MMDKNRTTASTPALQAAMLQRILASAIISSEREYASGVVLRYLTYRHRDEAIMLGTIVRVWLVSTAERRRVQSNGLHTTLGKIATPADVELPLDGKCFFFPCLSDKSADQSERCRLCSKTPLMLSHEVLALTCASSTNFYRNDLIAR